MQSSEPQGSEDRRPQQHSRGSIATRLLWSYLASSTVPLLLLGALLLNISLATQRDNVYANQRSLSDRAAADISRYLSGLTQEFIAFETLVRPNDTTIDDWRNEALRLSERAYPNLLEMSVLDLNGAQQLRIEQLQAVPDTQLEQLGADPLFQQVIATNTPLFVPDSAQPVRTIQILLPLHNDAGTTIGALQATIDASPMIDALRTSVMNTKSYAYLVRAPDGQLVVDDGSFTFTLPKDMAGLLAQPSQPHEYEGARNITVVGSAAPIVLSNGADTGMMVISEQQSAVAFVDVRRSIWVLALVIVLVGSLVVMWSLRMARSFITPLTALSHGASLLGAGHLEHRITVINDDELGEVATAFNAMAGHLQASLDQIERQNERLRHGLALARDIQLGLLPDRAPWGNEEIAVFARSIPAYEVGGDFYTYIALSEGRAAIAIGDISGKGVGAALLMSLTSSAVESHGRELEHPAEVLGSLNQLLAPRLKANHMNAALMFVVFDPRERLLRIANAGMIAPVLIKPSGSHFLEVGGLPIGAYSGAMYHDLSIDIEPEDVLLLLSDGVVEAHNPQGEMFGFERLEQLLDDAAGTDVRALVELVLSRVQEFIGEAEQHDDITLVAVRPTISFDGRISAEEEEAAGYATL